MFALSQLLPYCSPFVRRQLKNPPVRLPVAKTIPVNQIHTGMRGYALTVFQGVKPESMDVEVLGILKNMNGPKGDIILVRLHGEKAEYTGVVAGMSGSPVYFDGKLAGALAFRIGEFSEGTDRGRDSRRRHAGNQCVRQESGRHGVDHNPYSVAQFVDETLGPGQPSDIPVQSVANYLKPIDTPLVFNGFSEEAVKLFAPQFASSGIVPVVGGAGSSSDQKQPEPLEPGSAVSAVLVRGDMGIAATCTVTYIDTERLLACGHPLLQFGSSIADDQGERAGHLAVALECF